MALWTLPWFSNNLRRMRNRFLLSSFLVLMLGAGLPALAEL
ncbi:MAG TPA: hypothetical protein VK724_23400 [Bryobacteraceae bacterium]|nr:hypothetical protein [Bryobacteraceae bacterium]